MSQRKNFRQSDWLIELSRRKNVEPRIVGIRSTFCGSTFFRLVEIRLKTQEYKGALFERLESGWAYNAQLKTKQNRKQDNKTRHRDQN